MRSIITIPALALCLLTSVGACAEITTCQDVIAAKDQTAMRQAILPLRDAGFKVGAYREAELVYQGLQSKGIYNSFQGTLDYYESVLIPARAGAGEEFDNLVSANGGLAATISLLCSDRNADMISFFSKFYHTYYYNHPRGSQGQHNSE
jgi:hypothetical protein